MGRTREFNDEAALKKAIMVFWEKGYENSSLKDLLKEMEILNGSFYNTYGNKKNLFIDALKFYDRDFTDKRTALFSSAKLSFKEKIRIMFEHILDRQEEAVCPKGCFLFNSVSLDTLKELEIYKLVRSSVDKFEEFLEIEISKAITNQELAGHINAKATASILITYMQGLMKLSVLDYEDANFRNRTEYFLTSLGL